MKHNRHKIKCPESVLATDVLHARVQSPDVLSQMSNSRMSKVPVSTDRMPAEWRAADGKRREAEITLLEETAKHAT